ncbi:hypothetical protein HAX54_011430, partial [Datura stramonium]|nr:hypothetical protein [Datura stramonium]
VTLCHVERYSQARNDIRCRSHLGPRLGDRMIYVTIEDANLKDQNEYWKSTFIGCVIGGTSYMRSMEAYVMKSWNMTSKSQ